MDVSPLPAELLALTPESGPSTMPHLFHGYLSDLTHWTAEDIVRADELDIAVRDPRAPIAREALLGPDKRPTAFSIWWNILKSICQHVINHMHKLFTLCTMCNIMYYPVLYWKVGYSILTYNNSITSLLE